MAKILIFRTIYPVTKDIIIYEIMQFNIYVKYLNLSTLLAAIR